MAAPKKYSDELREGATRLALESGRPIAHVAKDLGVDKEALRTWVRQAKADAAGGTATVLSSAERERLKELEREVRELRQANEDTTDCPRRWFSGAGAGGAVAASVGGLLAGGAGVLASPWRVAPVARAARWQPLADSCGVD
jgi:transposase